MSGPGEMTESAYGGAVSITHHLNSTSDGVGHVREAKQDEATDVWGETCGAWKRREPASRIASKVRRAFTAAMERHRPTRKRRGR